jgi:5-methylcytosine-specific restriction protein A
MPGCSALVRGRRFCDAHAKQYDARRGSAAARGYTPAWNQISRAYRRAHPLCEHCLQQNRTSPSECTDHIIPKARGGTDHPSNLRALCWSCHSRKTALEDGGFGRAPRASARATTSAHVARANHAPTSANNAPLANTGQRGGPRANVAGLGGRSILCRPGGMTARAQPSFGGQF